MRKISHAGVLPYRVTAGSAEFLLITTRGSQRWIIPKGRRERDQSVRKTALVEGFEEAGLKGVMGRAPLGTFLHRSKGESARVLVFPLRVTQQARSWPEKRERQVKWFAADEAVASVHSGLGELIKDMHSRLTASGKKRS